MSGVGTEADTEVRPTGTEMYLGGKKSQGQKPKILWVKEEEKDPPDREDTEIRISKAPYGFYLEVVDTKPKTPPEGDPPPSGGEKRLYLEAFVGLHSGMGAYKRAEQIREYGLVVV